MLDNKDLSPKSIKNKQYKTLFIVSMITIFVILAILYMMKEKAPTDKSATKMKAVSFSSSVDHIDAQSIWLERAQNQLKNQQKQQEELKQEVARIKTSVESKKAEEDPKYIALQQKNEFLEKSLLQKPDSQAQVMQGGSAYQGNVFPTTPGVQIPPADRTNNLVEGNHNAGIENDELKLKPVASLLPKKNPETYVPAGSFAEAIMLGAADASAGVSSQANPSPMLFRITEDGTLPNHHKSHLKDCFVTAAVVGDISSERGEIRLERISCTYPNGEIVEQTIEGTIFGMDAKNGVRGTAYWGEGNLLFRAGVAGTLSGLGSGISQSFASTQISPLGTTSTVQGANILKSGIASGVSNGMEKLADYNIRRADQFHPIIQIPAGQKVYVVILKGYYLDGKKHDEDHDNTNADPEIFPASTSLTDTGLTLSEQQLQKIKQHEEAMGWVNNKNTGDIP